MKFRNISEAEWEVLQVLWTRSPQSAAEVIEAVRQKKSWAVTTIRTLLKRLTQKGIIKAQKIQGLLSFEPLVSREICVKRETESFLSRIFRGDPAPMLLHFIRQAELSPEEVDELREILKSKTNSKK